MYTLLEAYAGNDGSNYTITVTEGITITRFRRDGIIRQLVEAIFSRAPGGSVADLPGYRLSTLTNANIALASSVDVLLQQFTGTLSGAVAIAASLTGAANGCRFEISLKDLIVTAANNLTIKSASTTLLTYNEDGKLNGNITLAFNGTAWVVFQERVTLT